MLIWMHSSRPLNNWIIQNIKATPLLWVVFLHDGVVATCSYEARKFGVHSAMPISWAKKLCPDGIYVYPRMDRYKEVSHQIFSIMKEFTPHIEPLSIDEAFL